MLQRLAFLVKTRLYELAKYSLVLRSLKAVLLTLRALLHRDPARRLCWLCRAYSATQHAFLREPIACAIERTLRGRSDADLDWRRTANASIYRRWEKIDPQLCRTVVLKAPGPNGERGAILVTFEYNWFLILEDPALFRALCAEYNLVLSSSWSPTDHHLLALAVAYAPGSTFWVQPNNLGDCAKIEALHPRLKALRTMPCDWLNPEFFPESPAGERDIDLLIVSNWAPFKRHWALFRALRHLPASLRIVCLGQPDSGKTMADVRRLKDFLGAPQDIQFVESVPAQQVTALQSRARLALILSRWEGCCVAAVEALMAGTPLAMCRTAHVGSLAYINDNTGFLLSIEPSAAEIRHALDHAPSLRPRSFAIAHSSYLQSTHALNRILRDHEISQARPWSQDIAPVFWRAHPKLANPADQARLTPAALALSARFPKRFPANLLEVSYQ